jgi:hypothetical protein
MKPVWKFASSCGGFIYTGVYTKITATKTEEGVRKRERKEGGFLGEKFFSAAGGRKIFPLSFTTQKAKARAVYYHERVQGIWATRQTFPHDVKGRKKCTRKHRSLVGKKLF